MSMKDLILSMMLESLEEKASNPYAIGMAAAMKASGDEPPLEKSTIRKAHKIAKGIEKNEEIELDEADGRRIVDDLKSKGHHEEAGAMAHKHGLGRSYGPHFGMRSSKYSAETAFHKGYDKAAIEAKKKNEEVELDELNKKTLGSYIKKASTDSLGRGIHAASGAQTPEAKKSIRKLGYRMQGIARATDKLTKEETEQFEEQVAWSHNTYDDYVAHNKAKGLQVLPKDLWHRLKKNPYERSK